MVYIHVNISREYVFFTECIDDVLRKDMHVGGEKGRNAGLVDGIVGERVRYSRFKIMESLAGIEASAVIELSVTVFEP